MEQVEITDGSPQPVFGIQAEQQKQTGRGKGSIVLRPEKLDEIEPWYKRAWTLQGMLFSDRRLQYRDNQTSWVCYCSEPITQECNGWIGSKDKTYTNYSDAELFESIMSILRFGKRFPQVASIVSYWYDLV
ncbi:HET domain containing protein [Colletotrichum tofieldiae]|nr:HET domain containing protein [Colletotrichum tofieldiae]GKT71908.1 HET domain containing protein [Colletotrichum tofieldiae]